MANWSHPLAPPYVLRFGPGPAPPKWHLLGEHRGEPTEGGQVAYRDWNDWNCACFCLTQVWGNLQFHGWCNMFSIEQPWCHRKWQQINPSSAREISKGLPLNLYHICLVKAGNPLYIHYSKYKSLQICPSTIKTTHISLEQTLKQTCSGFQLLFTLNSCSWRLKAMQLLFQMLWVGESKTKTG